MSEKPMPICSKCGKEYSYGSYHHIHCGVVSNNDRKDYGWNCVKAKDLCEIKEKIIESFMKPSKIDSLYTFE